MAAVATQPTVLRPRGRVKGPMAYLF
jgi:hypothetical protein